MKIECNHDTDTKLENFIKKLLLIDIGTYCRLCFSSKLKCPSLAQLGLEPFQIQIGLTQLGKF